MTDIEKVRKKLDLIDSFVRELRVLARPEEIERDVREQRFVLHTLQLAIQAALDVASHIVADDQLGEPRQYRDLFLTLVEAGWLPRELTEPLTQMAGFRYIVVHGYEEVDLATVRRSLDRRLGDLNAFTAGIRARLG